MKKPIYLIYLLLIPVLLIAEQPSHHNIENYEECGLPRLDELLKRGEGRARPTLSGTTLFINTTNYRIHYTLSGADATTQAYAESTAVAAESVWSRLTALGWFMPPPDGTNGGNSKYDIYIRSIGYLGVCYPENSYTTPFPDGYSSWVEIINTGITVARLRALVTHEVGHGIQMRYSKFEEPMWAFYENTSVFMEDIVFDDVNTLYGRLNNPDNPLTNPQYKINRATGVYEYRGALWTHFLDQYYDTYPARTVRRVWDLCGRHSGSHLLKDIDSVLGLNYSSNFAKAMGHYAIWRYFTGTRNDNLHYEEASSYVLATVLRNHTSYPASGDQGSLNPSGPGGCNFVTFTNIGNNRITLYFDGLIGYEWSAYVLGIGSGGISYEYKIQLEPTQDTGRITIPGWDFNTVVLIPVVTHWTSTASNLTYSYSATISSADKNIAGELSDNNYTGFYITPNPARNEIRVNYFIPADKSGKLNIYNTNGQLIKTTQLTTASNSYIWNRTDNFGHRVSNGIYFVELSCGDKIIKQKVLLLD